MDVKQEVNNIVNSIKDYFKAAGKTKAVVGNSGGKDSAVVIGLLSMALGSENVIAITMPCYSISQDYEDAMLVVDRFKVRSKNLPLNDVNDSMHKTIFENYGEKLTGEAAINLKPRLRMTMLYAIAALENALVVGTGNKCELYIGYFTKYGDGGCDYNPIADYLVSEVYQIARHILVPSKIIAKDPADGISGKSDEEKLGFTYAQVEDVILTGKTVDVEAQKRIERMHVISEHKRTMPKCCVRL